MTVRSIDASEGLLRMLMRRPAIPVICGLIALLPHAAATPAWAASAAPTLTGPTDGTTLSAFEPTLTWANPGGATQYHLQVTPHRNDGPGIDVHIGSIGNEFTVPPPPSWYGLLPDMTYTWRVRVSDATTFVNLTDPSWGPWAERRFRTPAVTSTTINPLTPATGDVVNTLTPSIQWQNSRGDVFYYETQLSKDPTFNIDPATATAMVYSSLLHGGVTAPLNAYAVPPTSPLEDNTRYYWRVRPRIQGDGKPLDWSAAYSFQTKLSATPTLTIDPVSFGLTAADAATCQVANPATSFPSTPTLTGLYYSYRFTGEGTASLSWYWNDRPILADKLELSGIARCRIGTAFGTPGGGPDAEAPLQPGSIRYEIWQAGRKAVSGAINITPAASLAVGPISVGTQKVSGSPCRIAGITTSFPVATPTLYFRWNTVGRGPLGIRLQRGTTPSDVIPVESSLPADCWPLPISPAGGWNSGTYRLEVLVGGQVVQTTHFTVA